MQHTEVYARTARPAVFLIEPEQVVRSALEYILRERYGTHAFASMDEAMASPMKAPAVVLIGIAILRDRGEEVLAELSTVFATTKILLVAERICDPVAQAGLKQGAHGVISNPISFDSVCDAVRVVLGAPDFPGAPSRLVRVAFG
ncbi:response regulator [Bradyrhizobium sp. CCGB01]|uniref:response regulator n=1 Tax=Bradyrhizobium sp. CCGB01 TaxID=2949634 RepID=UPI0020B37A77|nr:response regulator [Bradyrhizobium sp. CCGB01]MCP3405516.1 response regulator [Bradyrhizobium sp. CCGB01]